MSSLSDRQAGNLLAEFSSYFGASTPRYDRALIARGVPEEWLFSGAARFGVARARLDRKTGLWEPGPDGRQVVVLPEPPLSDPGDPGWPSSALADLVTFCPAHPKRWGRRTGLAVLLNFEAVDEAMFRDLPLLLHETPLDWMRAGGQGACVLDWSALLHLHLGGAPEIMCATLPLAERLDRALTTRGRHGTRITVANNERAA